jgi:hypothetical protein
MHFVGGNDTVLFVKVWLYISNSARFLTSQQRFLLALSDAEQPSCVLHIIIFQTSVNHEAQRKEFLLPCLDFWLASSLVIDLK